MTEAQYILTLAEAKTCLGISGSTEDDYINALIASITSQLESYFDVVFVKRDIVGELHSVPYNYSLVFQTKRKPIYELTKIEFKDTDLTFYEVFGSTSSTKSFNYSQNGLVKYLDGALTTELDTIKVDYKAGIYTANTDIPKEIKNPACDMLKTMYNTNLDNGGEIKSESLGDYSYTLKDLKDTKYPNIVVVQIEALKEEGLY